MSDIGILNAPGDLAAIFLFLAWPYLLVGALAGAFVGGVLLRLRRRWIGLLAGAVAGLLLGVAAFLLGMMWRG